jgi:hypothetical protein
MRLHRLALAVGAVFALTGCAAIAIVDTAVGVATTAVDITVGAVGAAADAVTPDPKPDCAKPENAKKDDCKKKE